MATYEVHLEAVASLTLQVEAATPELARARALLIADDAFCQEEPYISTARVIDVEEYAF